MGIHGQAPLRSIICELSGCIHAKPPGIYPSRCCEFYETRHQVDGWRRACRHI